MGSHGFGLLNSERNCSSCELQASTMELRFLPRAGHTSVGWQRCYENYRLECRIRNARNDYHDGNHRQPRHVFAQGAMIAICTGGVSDITHWDTKTGKE